jgi:hypothetical protein
LTVAEAEALGNANRIPIRTAVNTYLEQKSGKAKKTVAQYRLTLNEFTESLDGKVRFLDDISDDVLRRYKKYMIAQDYAGKTIDTRLNIVFFLLKKNAIKARIPRDEMPTIEEEAPVSSSPGDTNNGGETTKKKPRRTRRKATHVQNYNSAKSLRPRIAAITI